MADDEKINEAVASGKGNEGFIYACEIGNLAQVKKLLLNELVDPAYGFIQNINLKMTIALSN
jgi:hypothetical protein